MTNGEEESQKDSSALNMQHTLWDGLFTGAKRLRYLDDIGSIEGRVETVRKLTLGLIRYLRARNGKE